MAAALTRSMEYQQGVKSWFGSILPSHLTPANEDIKEKSYMYEILKKVYT